MIFDDILPGLDERAFITGWSGSGKTTLLREILREQDGVVVVDPKHTFTPHTDDEDKYETACSVSEAVKAIDDGSNIIFRPDVLGDGSDIAEMLREIYQRGNLTLAIDECYGLHEARNRDVEKFLRAILTRGRELQIAVIAASQRPSWIPLFYLSESNRFYLFGLKLPNDKKRMSDVTGISVRMQDELEQYWFWYSDNNTEPLKVTLNL